MLAEAAPSLLSELRAATSRNHATLDGKLALLDGAVTMERYRAFLRGSLIALRPLEAALAPWSSDPASSRCAMICADLAAVAGSVPALDEPRSVRMTNLGQVFGARYVIEGSALGGAVLARAFQKALGLDADSLHYLTLHGERLGERWRAFVNELETWGESATPSMRSEACDSARAVFDRYEAAFESTCAFFR